MTNATAGGIGNETAPVYTIAQAAGQYGYISFYGISGFSGMDNNANGTANQTVWNLTWIANAPVGSTKIQASLTGRAYTETWNITSANTNMTVSNASLVVTPSFWYTRVGAPSAVTFNGTSLTTSGYTTNFTDIEAWTNLNVNLTDANMLRYGSGYETLSMTFNGPTISSSSGSLSSAVSVVPTTSSQKLGMGLLIGIASLIVIVSVTALVVSLRKRR